MTQMNAIRRFKKLTEVDIGAGVTVVKSKLDDGEWNRLRDLGLHLGSVVRVLNHPGADAALLLAVGDGRIGVNREVAEQIYVHED